MYRLRRPNKETHMGEFKPNVVLFCCRF